MKTFLFPRFALFLVAYLCCSFIDPYAIKRISDTNYRYEFYVSDKKISPKSNKTYYWFKGGAIHSSESGISGNALDGEFVKMYHSNQLAENGYFKNGLKTGLWKTWYTSGTLESMQYYRNGVRKGQYSHFDQNGNLTEKGKYKENLKDGLWIDLAKKDTLHYSKGIVTEKKGGWFKRKKRQPEENTNKIKQSEEAKPGFFKRLFSKKTKKSAAEQKQLPKAKETGFWGRFFKKNTKTKQ